VLEGLVVTRNPRWRRIGVVVPGEGGEPHCPPRPPGSRRYPRRSHRARRARHDPPHRRTTGRGGR
jgi:hypothetical protein